MDPHRYRCLVDAKEQRPEDQLCHTCQASDFGTFGDLIAPPSFGVDLYNVVPLRWFVGSICAKSGVFADRCRDRAVRYTKSHGRTLRSRGFDERDESVARMGKTDELMRTSTRSVLNSICALRYACMFGPYTHAYCVAFKGHYMQNMVYVRRRHHTASSTRDRSFERCDGTALVYGCCNANAPSF